MAQRMKALENRVVVKGKLPALVYGLDGIMEIFQVSKSTAWRYKEGFLKPAITQNGHVIICDVRKALECFGVLEANRLVK